MNQSHPEKAEKLERVGEQFGAAIRELGREVKPEWEKEFDRNFMSNGELLQVGIGVDDASDIKEFIRSLLLKTRTAEQERVVGIIDNVPSEKLIQTLIDRGYTKIEELTD